jgi:hypothetical protein
LRRTTGSYSKGAIPPRNRSAQAGEWSSRHYGGEGMGFLPSVPRGVRATRWGRDTRDPGRPGRVRREGRVERGWHSQTKGRATENTNIGLQPLEGGRDRSGSEVPAEALPGVGAGHSTQERRQNKRRRSVARCDDAARPKRPGRGGRPRTQLSVRKVKEQGVKAGGLDSSLCERPTPSREETVERHDSPSSESRPGKIPGLVQR